MSSSYALILWPASVFFTAVLSFRVGMWWREIHQHGRHAFAPGRRGSSLPGRTSGRRHSDDASAYLNGGVEPWGEEREPGDEEAQLEVTEYQEADASWMPGPPAAAEHGHWWREDEDTEVLPRLQDIRPPTRATPIRRPPWVGRHRREERDDE